MLINLTTENAKRRERRLSPVSHTFTLPKRRRVLYNSEARDGIVQLWEH